MKIYQSFDVLFLIQGKRQIYQAHVFRVAGVTPEAAQTFLYLCLFIIDVFTTLTVVISKILKKDKHFLGG